MTSYNVEITLPSNTYNAYIIVNNNIITEMHEYGNITNIILNTNDTFSNPRADNMFPITTNGFNFMSNTIAGYLNVTNNHFNIYLNEDDDDSDDVLILSSFDGSYDIFTATINITLISTSCYEENTKILSNGVYVAIKYLNINDIVDIYGGNDCDCETNNKKIKYIGKNYFYNNPDDFRNCMYIMKKQNDMLDDLLVTGYHSILVDNLTEEEIIETLKKMDIRKIKDKYLLLSSISNKFEKIQEIKKFTYYHLALESNDENEEFGIWANGVLSETTSIKNFLSHEFL